MPLWRCPHCGTPQVESSRCWVCRRSTTSCAACRHYRRAIAGGLGLCGLDPRHPALRGTEMRACWDAAATTGSLGPGDPGLDAPEPSDTVLVPAMAAAGSVVGRPARTFVPVATSDQAGEARFPAMAALAAMAILAAAEDDAPASTVRPTVRPRRIPGGWSLWGDFEP